MVLWMSWMMGREEENSKEKSTKRSRSRSAARTRLPPLLSVTREEGAEAVIWEWEGAYLRSKYGRRGALTLAEGDPSALREESDIERSSKS